MSLEELKERNCSFWLCSHQTRDTVLREGIFATSLKASYLYSEVKVGDAAFLIDISTDEILGVFRSKSEPYQARYPILREFPIQMDVGPVGEVKVLHRASHLLGEKLRLKMRKLTSGYPVPRQGVYGPEITKALINLFEGKEPVSKGQITFEDVVGLEEVKELVRDRVILPVEEPELAREYGIAVGGGLLLAGPPGTGKTHFARAVAGELNAEFLEISPNIIQGYPGQAEEKISQVFERAVRLPQAVIFIDECEALLMSREKSGTSTVMPRVTATFRAWFSRVYEMQKPILLIGASNRPQDIDPAFLRSGRFGVKVYIGLPGYDERRVFIGFYLKKKHPVHRIDREDIEWLAEQTYRYSSADLRELLREAALLALKEARDRGVRVEMQREHLESALHRLSYLPSVSEDEEREIREWAQANGFLIPRGWGGG